ncbi:putative reticulocyte-binding protein 2 like protein a protein [Parachaetomium inaequale]|uniref:Reticulocyte-binding protein 2 like protein a protein n=1 Tax=Parachaetomium inaequale TaxID=2588326 RepID=A0AAN6P887_9PEZI|nr:putative reticulocyte-binding protein 2 like protein a protein [Parachaetomium inaequale]
MGVPNPDVIFNLMNPDRGYDTCTGEACTYGRRCRRRVASARMASARSLLYKLTTEDPTMASKSADLKAAAELTLCYQHTGQILELMREWRARLLLYAASAAGSSTNTGGQSSQKERAEKQRTEEETRRKQDKKRREEKARREEEQARREKEKAEADERKARQKAEERRKKQQRAEESSGNQQQKSQRRAEEREAEKQEWADAWRRYCNGWMLLETGKTQATPSEIPWPVKSGSWQDVSESSVRYFFCKAVPVHLADHQGEEMYRTICNENKRWHTDKITCRFGPGILKGPYGDAMSMIAKLMVQVRIKAKMARGKQRL